MRNRVLLINSPLTSKPDYRDKGCVFPTNALMLIGTILKNINFDVTIIDGQYSEDYEEQSLSYLEKYRESVVFVGFSVMTTQLPITYALAKRIKGCVKEIPIIFGGSHPTFFPEQTVKNDVVDIVVINEGSRTVVELANKIQQGDSYGDVKGIAYQDGDRVVVTEPAEKDDMKELPFFDFTLLPEGNNYFAPTISVYKREFPSFKGDLVVAPMLTALGCPYRCTFCFNVILRRKYRYKSAEAVVNEIMHLQKTYSINTFVFMDEDFFVSKKRVLEFLDLVEKHDLHFNWRMWCRVDHMNKKYMDDALMQRLSKIGAGSLVMGGESGSQETLNAICKDITVEQIIHSLEAVGKTKNIVPRYSFMVGVGEEKMVNIRDTYRLCFKMKKINPWTDIAGPFFFRLYPGSPLYNDLVSKYQIDQPKAVNEWEDYLTKHDITYSPMPWTPKKFQRRMGEINFYSNYAFQRITFRTSPRAIAELFLIVISRMRLKTFFFFAPLEYSLFKFAKKFK